MLNHSVSATEDTSFFVYVRVRFAVRHKACGESASLIFNAVLCEFNVEKRCQTNNPEEQNCLFSKQRAELSEQLMCKEAPQQQRPRPSQAGTKSSPGLILCEGAEMGAPTQGKGHSETSVSNPAFPLGQKCQHVHNALVFDQTDT